MQPNPLPRNLSPADLEHLASLESAIAQADAAFTCLSDETFNHLPKEYRRLADAILRVCRNRSVVA